MKTKILRNLYQPYKFIVFIPLLAIFTTIMGSMAVILSFIAGEKIGSYCGIIWARLLAFFTPMFLMKEGRENMDKKQSYVVISNHQSHYDILVLYGWLGVDFKWVMKQELRKIPFLGIACYKLGHIFIDRSNTKAALTSINEAKKKITNGTSVLFFPEGTRSKNGNTLKFKRGAFKMALDLGIPILPVTINHTYKILPTDTIDLFPGCAKMSIHPPMDIKGYTEDNMTDLIRRVKNIIESKLET